MYYTCNIPYLLNLPSPLGRGRLRPSLSTEFAKIFITSEFYLYIPLTRILDSHSNALELHYSFLVTIRGSPFYLPTEPFLQSSLDTLVPYTCFIHYFFKVSYTYPIFIFLFLPCHTFKAHHTFPFFLIRVRHINVPSTEFHKVHSLVYSTKAFPNIFATRVSLLS